jgi:hypothetical protein
MQDSGSYSSGPWPGQYNISAGPQTHSQRRVNDHDAPLEVRGVLARAWVAVLCREMLLPPAASTTIAALLQDTHNFFSCRCCWLRVAATSQREPIHRQ